MNIIPRNEVPLPSFNLTANFFDILMVFKRTAFRYMSTRLSLQHHQIFKFVNQKGVKGLCSRQRCRSPKSMVLLTMCVPMIMNCEALYFQYTSPSGDLKRSYRHEIYLKVLWCSDDLK